MEILLSFIGIWGMTKRGFLRVVLPGDVCQQLFGIWIRLNVRPFAAKDTNETALVPAGFWSDEPMKKFAQNGHLEQSLTTI